MGRLSLSDQLARLFVAHDINVSRLQADHRRTLFKVLAQLEAKIVAAIAAETDGETFTAARSRLLLKAVRAILDQGYKNLAAVHARELKAFAAYEATTIPTILNTAITTTLFTVGLPESAIPSLLSDATVIGAPLKSYWAQQRTGLVNRFITEMRAGLFAGETTPQLIRRVRGTRAQQFRNGIMQVARNGAEVVVRTAAQSVMNDIRMKVYTENSDVVAGVQAQVTLDARTSDICIARSGEAWDLEGHPLKGTTEPFPGPPPWHPNCRSTLIPILKTFGELLDDPALDRAEKKKLRGLSTGTQSSMNGQVAGDLTYEQWLTDQPASVQREVLGPARLTLWKAKKISLRDLIDQRGNPLTLDQLKASS